MLSKFSKPLFAALVVLGQAFGSAHATDWVAAEVKKVDLERERVTLKHGPVPSQDMPAMTMVFRVADQAWLQKIAAGDQVEVQIDKVQGAFTVVGLKAQSSTDAAAEGR